MRSAGLPLMLVTREISGSVDDGRLIHGYMTEERAKAPAMVLAPRMRSGHARPPALPIADDSNGDSNGIVGAPTFPSWVVAALLNETGEQASAIARELVTAQLLENTGQDTLGCARYRFHDLVRDLARELLSDAEKAEGTQRLMDDYTALARRALYLDNADRTRARVALTEALAIYRDINVPAPAELKALRLASD
jgi:hypothetical protein